MTPKPKAPSKPKVPPKKGMGFKAAAKSVASKGGYTPEQAAAIVANASRQASPAAKKANPNLKKVAPKKATKSATTAKKSTSK